MDNQKSSEKLPPIMEWKKRGNEFFKQKNYLKAINCYEESLYILKQRKEELIKIEKGKLLTSEGEEDIKELTSLRAQLNGNLSLCHFKRGEIDEAEFYNDTCLSVEPEN